MTTMLKLTSNYCASAIPFLRACGATWSASRKVWTLTEAQHNDLAARIGRATGRDGREANRWYDSESTVIADDIVTMRTVTRDDLDGGDEDGNTAGQYVGARVRA